MLKERLAGGWRERLGGWLARPALRSVAGRIHYASYGGALLVGVKGICIIGHGRSTPAAVSSALRVAGELADQAVVEQLTDSFRRSETPAVETAVGQDLDS